MTTTCSVFGVDENDAKEEDEDEDEDGGDEAVFFCRVLLSSSSISIATSSSSSGITTEGGPLAAELDCGARSKEQIRQERWFELRLLNVQLEHFQDILF